MVDYPYEWNNYMKPDRLRTFRIDTPPDIIKQAKKINENYFESAGVPFFYFEGEQEGPEPPQYKPLSITPEFQKTLDEIREYIKSVAEGIKNGTLKSDDDDE